MSGPIEPPRPLSGRLAPVPAVQRDPKRERERERHEPRGGPAHDAAEDEGHGPDADGHVDLRA